MNQMKDYELDALMAACIQASSCEECPAEHKERCREFKRIIATIHEPYELYRLTEKQ